MKQILSLLVALTLFYGCEARVVEPNRTGPQDWEKVVQTPTVEATVVAASTPEAVPTPGAMPDGQKPPVGFTGAADFDGTRPTEDFPLPSAREFEATEMAGVSVVELVAGKGDQKVAPDDVVDVFLVARTKDRKLVLPPASSVTRIYLPKHKDGWLFALIGRPVGASLRLELSPEAVAQDQLLAEKAPQGEKVYVDVSIMAAGQDHKDISRGPWDKSRPVVSKPGEQPPAGATPPPTGKD